MQVSVIIPCYNVADFVAEAVASVLIQEWPNWEIILVDNNSTDDTRLILKELAQKHPGRIKVVIETTPGASAARNRGLHVSSGKFLQFLDADDCLLPGKFARQVPLLQQGFDVVIGTPVYLNLAGERFPLVPWQDQLKGLAHGMYCGQTSSLLLQRSILEEIGGWDASLPFTQDTDLLLRLMQANASIVLDTEHSCLVRDRREGKLTKSDPMGILVRQILLRERMVQWLQNDRPKYWEANAGFFYCAIYRYLRMLASRDQAKAVSLFHKHLPDDFQPKVLPELRIYAWNVRLFRWFGFKGTEKIKSQLRWLMPGKIWRKMQDLLKR